MTYPTVLADSVTPGLKSPFWFPYTEASERLFRGMTKSMSARTLSDKIAGVRETLNSVGESIKSKF
jgi:hypothetical protein